MSFSLDGKYGVGPLVLFLRQRHGGSRGLGPDSPVRRGRLDAPDIPGLIQRDSHQPILAFRSQRNAVSHAGRRARSSRKFVERGKTASPGSSKGWVRRTPHPSVFTTRVWQCSLNGIAGSRLARRKGICARIRVLRRSASNDFRSRAHIRTIFDCTSRNIPSFAGYRGIELKPKSNQRGHS